MAENKIKKLAFGFILIILAGVVLLSGFYLLKVKPELAKRTKVTSKNVDISKQKVDQRAAELKMAQQEPGSVNLNALIKEAEAVYGPQEKNRKEGVLWVDRSSSNLIVTLGALNGIIPGNHLSVYAGSQKVGQVTVDTSFDVISYVHSENALDLSANDYYRVSIE